MLTEYITYAQALYEKKISKIRMSDIQQIFNDISKEGKYATANLILLTLRTMFNKAKKWGLIENNPTLGIELHKLQARERRLSYELVDFYKYYVEKKIC
ncbi:integrase [Orientia tsutsugamushi]|uniref:Integrase n=1 Tax=Orientia tsutsugamushi TaxID=784 RepID=A0A2R8F221_ORITS|nr:hypothetical protein [Orientia tsutsugamushi]SPM44811.1 integrase [Orientia tsutsugamushi]SPM45472.1 integrase [Orientia tsutsugamushi]